MDVERKAVALTLPADAPPGRVQAVFSTFDVVDKQGDLVRASAFAPLVGSEVPLVWSHDWDALPVGKGTIGVRGAQALFDGAFHLQTQYSRDAYETVKAMGSLQEYSYGFAIAVDGWAPQQRAAGEPPIRVITEFSRIYEVSPVLVGAGEGTRTVAIKTAADLGYDIAFDPPNAPAPPGAKPFAHEHACRLADPSRFDRFRRHNAAREHDGKAYDVIFGHPKTGGAWEPQAFRYPSGTWTAAAARSHCAAHAGTFEAAAGKVGARLSRATRGELEAAITALQTLLAGALAAEAEPDPTTAALAPDAPLAPTAFALEQALQALLRRAEASSHAEVRTAHDALRSLRHRLPLVTSALDARVRAARVGDAPDPQELGDAWRALHARLAPIVGGG